MHSIFFRVAIVAFALVILTGCGSNGNAKETATRSTWLAYWDLDAGEKDLRKVNKKLDQLSYFGAYFDDRDHIVIPQELADKKTELNKKRKTYITYLSIVNDRKNPDGSVVLKDPEVLRRIFADEVALAKHADEIVALTMEGGYDGIEIDYERIWTDEKIGLSFVEFIRVLQEKALANNLKLRVVLEPSTPFSSACFIEGPEYVVMLYNLFGLHSGPGPKANKGFIKKTITRMGPLPGNKSIALATGGCLWGDNGEKRFLREVDAKDLAKSHKAKPIRDEESQCLVFNYTDKEASYQVWYADAKTINYWISVAKEQGVNNVSLWRLGGNVDMRKIN